MSQALTVAPRETAGAGRPYRAPSRGRLSPHGPLASPGPRTPLSVVPVQPARRRIPFAVFSLLVLGAALAAVLMINIAVSSTQYDLVQLRNQQVALSQENEALVLEIEGREAPQNLAAAATKLNMVSSPTFGTIDLTSKKVTGNPEAATKGLTPEVLIAAPKLGSEESGTITSPAQKSDAGESTQVTEPTVDAVEATTLQSVGTSTDALVELSEGATVGTIPGPVQSSGDR